MVQWTVTAINEAIEKDLKGFAAASEDNYTDQVMAVAMQIRNVREERPFILVSGPSGSGKTTTALRIETLLDDRDCETATVSLDNYFLPHDAGELPLDETGDPDYESPDRLDIELLQKHLKAIYRCEPVEVPRFDFATQSRLPGDILKRRRGELLLIEGIHTLNPHVMGDCLDYATDVYVSVEDEIVTKSGAVVTPAKLRLMRRLVRDRLFRGSDVDNTLERYLSVSRGERSHIAIETRPGMRITWVQPLFRHFRGHPGSEPLILYRIVPKPECMGGVKHGRIAEHFPDFAQRVLFLPLGQMVAARGTKGATHSDAC